MSYSHVLTEIEEAAMAAVIAGNQTFAIVYNVFPRYIRIPLTDDIQYVLKVHYTNLERFLTSLPFVAVNFSLNRIVRNATSETGQIIEMYLVNLDIILEILW
jgi:hypothetical protein